MSELDTTMWVTGDAYECSVTVDCAIFGFQEGVLKLLLVRKAVDPFKGEWLLPGGLIQKDQTAEEAFDSVLLNLTGLENIHKEQVRCYTDIHRHPVKRVITICYYGLIKPENHPIVDQQTVGGAAWFRLDDLPRLAFDHSLLGKDALTKLKSNVEERLILGELLPEKFTLTELQELYEALLDKKLDRRNFRKKIMSFDILEETDKIQQIGSGRPAKMFRFKKKKYRWLKISFRVRLMTCGAA